MTDVDPIPPLFAMAMVGVVFACAGAIMVNEGRHRRSGIVVLALGALYLVPPLVRIWIAGVMG